MNLLDDADLVLPSTPYLPEDINPKYRDEYFELSKENANTRDIEVILEDLLFSVHKRTSRKEDRALPRERPLPGWVDLIPIIPNFKIDHSIFEKLIFRESVLISLLPSGLKFAEPEHVGTLVLDIQAAKGNPYKKPKGRVKLKKNKFLVHLSSNLDYEGCHGGSNITGWVDKNLQTLEERRREYLHQPPGLDEQILYTVTQEQCYYLRHNRNKEIYYLPEKAPNLINESANFILMRYLALTKYNGQFECTTTYINGNICRNIYICDGLHSGIVNQKRLDLCKIERIIIEKCGIIHRTITILTISGKIIKQDWMDCDYVLQVNPTAIITAEKPAPLQQLRLHQNWKNDFELFSKYLEQKDIAKRELKNYMNQHPEINEIVSDYLQYILELKPEDVIQFTSKYFLNFTPNLIPKSEYFEQSKEDMLDDDNLWFYL